MKSNSGFVNPWNVALRARKKFGAGLMFVMGIAGVLAMFTGAVGLGAVNHLHNVRAEGEIDQARFAATGGIQAALARLSRPRHWPTASEPWGDGNVSSDVDFNYDPDVTKLRSASNPTLLAEVRIYNNTANAFHRCTQGPDGVPIPNDRILVISSGIYNDGARREATTVSALVKPSGVSFDKAMFGNSEVKVLGSLVDCVDSSVAGWTPAAYTPYDMVANPVTGASIASNNNLLNSIELDGASKVDGNINSGPNSVLGAITYLGALVTGSDGSLASAKDNNKVFAPATGTTTLSPGDANYTGPATVLTLNGGSYTVGGDLNLSGGMSVVVTAPTTIYVSKNVNITGGTKLNITGKPSDLQIYSSGSSTNSIEIKDSQGSFLMAGAELTAHIDNSEVFGAVVANKVKAENNTKLHYDKALAGKFFGSTDWTTDSFLGRGSIKTLTVTPPAGGPPSDPMAASASSSSTGGTTGGASGTTTGTTTGSTTSGTTTGTTTGSTTSGTTTGTTTGSTTSGTTTGTTTGSTTSGTITGTTTGSTTSGTTTGTTTGSTTSGTTTGTTTGSTTSGTTTGTTTGSTTSGGTGWDYEKKICCRDFSCGPPRCMLW
jgi:hypothetical protein